MVLVARLRRGSVEDFSSGSINVLGTSQILSFITPLLIDSSRVGRVVSACLLPGARSRWRHGCRELMVDGGGDWDKGLLGKG